MVFRSILVYVILAAVLATGLAALLLQANPGPFGVLGFIETAVSMLWICLVTNGLFLLSLAVAWPVVKRLSPRAVPVSWYPYEISGLIALNLLWIMWHRLAMAHQFISVRPFMTWTGLIELLVLAVIAVGIIAGGFYIACWREHFSRAFVCSVTAVMLILAVLMVNAKGESEYRVYSLDRIREAASGGMKAHETLSESGASGKIFIIGVDGLSWNVMVPLMQAGKLPTLSRAVSEGAIGYLDNDNDSYSPIIWTTIFTGMSPDDHGITGFLKIRFPRSGVDVKELLTMKPSIDTFYGIYHLLQQLPSLNLWELEWAGSNDRLVPTVWELASNFDHPVVVVNPLVSLPVRPLNGAMIDTSLPLDGSVPNFYPAELKEMWRHEPVDDPSGGNEESFRDITLELFQETDLTIELAKKYDSDLVVFYTHYNDTVSHTNWDFYARDDFFLTDLPNSLSDDRWENLVADNLDDRVFQAYAEIDRSIKRFMDNFPGATFIVVSDHGWSFSGYEHFASQEGVIMIWGPDVDSGTDLRNAHLLDVTPTALSFLNIPVSEEFQGRVLDEGWGGALDTVYIESYGEKGIVERGDEKIELGDTEIERLKAIGYVE